MPKVLIHVPMVIPHRAVGVRTAEVMQGETVEVSDETLRRMNPRHYLLVGGGESVGKAEAKSKAKAKAKGKR